MSDHQTRYPEEILLRDGRAIVIRRIESSDWRELVALTARLSPHARRMRFFTPKKRLTADSARHLANVDFGDRGAFVACFPGEKAIRAVGRYERDDVESAEVAFVVEDNLQGHGLATHLLRHIELHTRSLGYTRLKAIVLHENLEMLEVFRHYPLPQSEDFHGDTVDVILDLGALEHPQSEA